ncbi:MAG: sensor histidine kinase [Cyclonatronaceae bacterium]
MKERKNGRLRKSDQKGLLQDIARLKKEKEEIKKKYALVSLKSDQLEKSIKNLNHDLRSPLGGITGMIDILLFKKEDKLVVDASELNVIRESAQSILNLINATVETAGAQKKSEKHLYIDELLSSAMMEINRLYSPMAKNKDISLSLRTHIDKEIRLFPGFFSNLIQVVGNLVANAIKFTTAGGSVDVYSTLITEGHHSLLYITVTDTGKGLSPDQVSAFNDGKPVSRSAGTNGEESFGIGLKHVREMVSDDAGHIEVKSKKGSGTTFSLTCPLSDPIFIRESMGLSAATNGFAPVNGHQS